MEWGTNRKTDVTLTYDQIKIPPTAVNAILVFTLVFIDTANDFYDFVPKITKIEPFTDFLSPFVYHRWLFQ